MENKKNYTDAEKLEIANTIIRQMGGSGKLRAMVGAKDILATDAGVQFSFKGCKKTDKVVIELNAMDTYTVKFFKTARYSSPLKIVKGQIVEVKNTFEERLTKSLIPVEVVEGAYDDMLKPIFEETTGLYLSF